MSFGFVFPFTVEERIGNAVIQQWEGEVELIADEDDPDTWSVAQIWLDGHRRQPDGGWQACSIKLPEDHRLYPLIVCAICGEQRAHFDEEWAIARREEEAA
jgi:hypothetical protein